MSAMHPSSTILGEGWRSRRKAGPRWAMLDTMSSDHGPLAPVAVRNVLVPLDGSDLSLRAVPTARALGRRLDADVDTDDEHVLVVESGDPAEVIAGRAAELDSALVCMTTHGRGRLRGAFVGSVARAVLERVAGPVVALGPMADNPGWSPRPRSWPEPLSVRRIVACVDGTSGSEQVLPLAAAWAAALEMSLSIVTVVEDTPPPLSPSREPRYGKRGDAGVYVTELARAWSEHVDDVDAEVLRDPIGPASAIRQHLEQRPAGLVAVTTSARSGLERLRLGAVAASIVHASVAPCLVAPVAG